MLQFRLCNFPPPPNISVRKSTETLWKQKSCKTFKSAFSVAEVQSSAMCSPRGDVCRRLQFISFLWWWCSRYGWTESLKPTDTEVKCDGKLIRERARSPPPTQDNGRLMCVCGQWSTNILETSKHSTCSSTSSQIQLQYCDSSLQSHRVNQIVFIPNGLLQGVWNNPQYVQRWFAPETFWLFHHFLRECLI